jgi:HAD superfamily hydrolase (TIGR01549 family)
MRDYRNQIKNSQQLLALNGEDFIYASYQLLLNRLPDLDGKRYYLDRMYRGIDKITILKQIRHSTEGQQYQEKVIGLDDVIVRNDSAYRRILRTFNTGLTRALNHTHTLKKNVFKTDIEIIRDSGLFDKEYYQKQVKNHEDPYKHFCSIGVKQNISCNPYFDILWYQTTYNVNAEEINPFVHFCKYGAFEGKRPNLNFHLEWYCNEYSDMLQGAINPLYEYINFGKALGRFQNPEEKYLHELQVKSKNFFQDTTIENEQYVNLNGHTVQITDIEYLNYSSSKQRGVNLHPQYFENPKLVSFDIWDTILRRKCHPDEIKLSASRYLLINYYDFLKPAYRNIITLFKTRKISEDISSLTDDYEYRYEDAINVWLLQAFQQGIAPEHLIRIKNELLEHELAAELRSTEKDHNMDQFLKTIQAIPTIYASDFYMPKMFIDRLLLKNKVSHNFIQGYVSSDLLKNKRSGKLFDHITKEFQLNPHEILHIGDNIHADIAVPSKLGIKTFHYTDPLENRLHQWFDVALTEKLNGNSGLHANRILALTENLVSSLSPTNELEKIGIRFAPLVIGYTLHIIEEAKKLGVKTVYFFTREGIFLKEIYDLVVMADPYYSNYPKSEILEVSRIATFGPSLEKIDANHLMRLWNQYSIQSPQAFCKSLNIDNFETIALFKKFGFNYTEKITHPWENSRFTKLLASKEFNQIKSKTIDIQREYLQKYLSAKGLNSGNNASMIVDLGWRGTIQDNVKGVISEHLHGCYLGLFQYMNMQITGISKSGWLFDNNSSNSSLNIDEVSPIEVAQLCLTLKIMTR